MNNSLHTSAVAIFSTIVGTIPLALAQAPNNNNPGTPGGPSGWTQVFNDDFNGSSLDTSKWNTNWMGQNWWKSVADGGITYYSPNNLVVSNGTLKIVTKRESMEGFKYTTGIVTTQDKFTFGPGHYLEARVKAPLGKGLWSAFWTRSNGHGWDWPPEIDMFELWDHEWRCGAYQTWHFNNSASGVKGQTQYKVWGDASGSPWAMDTWGSGWFGDFHVFAADWQADRIEFYIDGIKTGSTTEHVTQYGNRLQFLILQLNGDGGWGPALDETTQLPAEFIIDYVRGWKKSATPAAYGLYSETFTDSFTAAGGAINNYAFNVTTPMTGAPEGSQYKRIVSNDNYAGYTWQYPAAGANVTSWSGKNLKFKARANSGGFEVALRSKNGTYVSVTLNGQVPTTNTWTDVSIPISLFGSVSLSSLDFLRLYRMWNSTGAFLEFDNVRVE